MARNINLCSTHRTYAGESAPHSLCISCWEVFMAKNPDYLRIIEQAHALVTGRVVPE